MDQNDKQENVIADYVDGVKQLEMEGYETAVRKARNALFFAGGLFFLGEMIAMYRADLGFEPLTFAIALIEAGIFIALALWTRKKPYTAVITGLIVFLGLIALSAVSYGILEGSTGVLKAVFSGIIVKVAILYSLIRPLKEAKALQQAKKEQSLGA
jgi:hypothetical protein